MMPSGTLHVQVQHEEDTIVLLFDRMVGDTPIMNEGEMYEYVIGTVLDEELRSLSRWGIDVVQHSGNRVTFRTLPGLNRDDCIARVVTVVAQAHNATPFVVQPA